jgi:nucleoside-diphosphate-sugar epimerase
LKILVTGASGFVGSATVARLAGEHQVVAAVRSMPSSSHPGAQYAAGLDLERSQGWEGALRGADAVVHCAAKVHRFDHNAPEAASDYRRVNVDGTLALARKAAELGVNRFVFLSSVKVNGERTEPGRPFRPNDPCRPSGPYAVSKIKAEEKLFELSERTAMDVVVIRPPLVYGPGVRANFLTMMRLLWRRVPLPLAAVEAKRSLLYVDNLADLIATTLTHDAAAGRVLLGSDGEDLSVPQMLRLLGAALGRPALLVPVPPTIVAGAGRLLGLGDAADRLLHWLQVDMSDTRHHLGWRPPVEVEDAFASTARYFKAGRRT